MARQSKLTLVIDAKNRAKRTLGAAKREVKGFADGVKQRFKGMFASIRRSVFSVQGALTALAGVGALATLAKRAFDLGSAVEETASKFRTVFGPAVERVNRFLDEFAAKAGLSRREAEEAAANAGGLAQGFGFLQEESAAVAEEILRLAGDFASFNNVPIEQTIRAVTSAMAGEREQLKQLQVVLRETEVQDRALANTGKATADALTQQERATATLELITEKAGVQVGDLNRTSDTAAARARRLGAEWRTFKEVLATAALPTLADALGLVGEHTSKLNEWSDAIRNNQAVISAWGRVVFETIKFIGQSAATLIRVPFEIGQVIGASIRGVFSLLAGNVLRVINQIGGHVNRMIEDLNKLPKINIDFRFNELPADRFLQDFNDQTENVWRNVQDGIGSLTALKDAWMDVFQASSAAARAQGAAAQAAQSAAPSGTPGGAAGGGSGGGGGGATPTIAGADRFPTTGLMNLEPAQAQTRQLSGLVRQEAGVMEEAFAGLGMAAQQSFEQMLQGALLASEGMKSGFLGAVAQMAAGKAAFYAAEAVASLAIGILGDPRGFAAAAKYAKAAAAMGAVAAGIGAAASAASGGGGAGGAAGGLQARAGQQADRAGEARQPPATVIIRGGFLDMNDPRQRREFKAAMENLTSRRIIIQRGGA